MAFVHKPSGFRVLAFRDTSNWGDWLQNASLWGESFSTFIFTALRHPITALSKYLTEIDALFGASRLYRHQGLENDLNTVNSISRVGGSVSGSRGEDDLIIGHSLGGGSAALVGAKYNLHSVSFAGPGIAMVLDKERIKIKDHRKIVTIRSDGDVIPTLSEHRGAVHHIGCRRKINESKSSSSLSSSLSFIDLSCHHIDAIVCELIRDCGMGQLSGAFDRNASLLVLCLA